ncbi:MAG TPA: hypothetical protein VNP92_08565, partial [Actinophytocola sp.]|nr:hypothetical protein [Actinophytocola sp.]
MWRKRIARDRCDGLVDGERPVRPKAGSVLTEAEREQLTQPCEPGANATPPGAQHLRILRTGRGEAVMSDNRPTPSSEGAIPRYNYQVRWP